MLVLAILLAASFFGLITAYIAGQKGYDVMTWYCIGLVVGPLGLGTLLLPQVERRAEAVPLR
ncbi:MAG: hypothetical protein R2810_17565 [Flavobacteriales bacterium]|nr:hypothetical protein [Flavobacteriales bacterium]MCB0785998.1 hypothetical protein [Flavobacteriales bacterium]MCB0788449.1 hypothetical protein [Flavobacteriales bacterium]MCB0808607.1 hypothetical protein [Flavobacteriales bacterium]MCB0813109.1 hypothetical protein [Flavobacteriales bacterium]